MIRVGVWAALAALGLFASFSPTFASETSIATGSETSSVLSDIQNRLYLNYFAVVHGTPLDDMSSSYTLDHNGNHSANAFNTINFDSEITTAYLITKDIGIGPDVPFLFVPVLGEGIILGDVGLKMFNRHWFQDGGFNVGGSLYLQAPTNKADKDRGLFMGFKSTPSLRYDIPSSRFAVGSWNEVKWYSGVTAGKTFKLYALPYVNYSLTPTFSLNLGYEMETDHMVGMHSALNFATYETDLQPGFVWFITPKVMVNPYLQIFTSNTITMGTTALGAVVSASL